VEKKTEHEGRHPQFTFSASPLGHVAYIVVRVVTRTYGVIQKHYATTDIVLHIASTSGGVKLVSFHDLLLSPISLTACSVGVL